MKKILTACFVLMAICSFAQPKPIELDKSPMDMSYWPTNYPILKMNGKVKDLPVARLIYSRPLKNGRTIFGGIIKYNEMWRLGANEATELETFQSLKIGGKIIPKGRYTLYCLPTENKWTIIINKDNYCWGNYAYDSKKDLLRTDINIEKTVDATDAFTAYFEESKNGASLVFLWDNVKTELPITIIDDKGSKMK